MDISSDVNGLRIRPHLSMEPKVSAGMLKNVCGKAITQKRWSLRKQNEGLKKLESKPLWKKGRMLEKMHDSIFPARLNRPRGSMYQCAEWSSAG